MIRTDLLRAKSVHAEAAYLHDLRRVRESKAHEEQKHKVVQEKERLFWREAVRGKDAPPHAENSQPTTVASVQILDRMWRAHSQLKDAFGQHRSVQRSLHDSLNRLASSKRCCEAVQTMVDKAQLLHQARLESRLSDEIAEFAGALRRAPTMSDFVGDAPLDSATDSTATRQAVSQIGESVTLQPPVLGGPGISHTSLVRSVDQALSPNSPSTISSGVFNSGPVRVQSAEVLKGADGPCLRVTCAIGSQGTLGMSLIKADGGGIKVMLDPTGSRVACGIAHDKGILQARLQALGIKVSAIEVASPDGVESSLGRAGRRVRRDDDEERIA